MENEAGRIAVPNCVGRRGVLAGFASTFSLCNRPSRFWLASTNTTRLQSMNSNAPKSCVHNSNDSFRFAAARNSKCFCQSVLCKQPRRAHVACHRLHTPVPGRLHDDGLLSSRLGSGGHEARAQRMRTQPLPLQLGQANGVLDDVAYAAVRQMLAVVAWE